MKLGSLATTLAIGASFLALAACGSPAGNIGDSVKADKKVAQSAYPDNLLWGDTHLHTNNSVDAFGFGVRLGPEDALRFARGEEVTSTGGLKAKLDRPLDFLVISDHSDGLGVTRMVYETPRLLIEDPDLQRWHDMMHEGPEGSQRVTAELINRAAEGNLPAAFNDPEASEELTRTIWQDSAEIVERYNEPGAFTAFIGFEWTLMPDGNNLHRVVMFRDGKAESDQVLPFSSRFSKDVKPEDLWSYMEAYEKKTGGRVLAIPHNSNISNGLMFEMTGSAGEPMTADYARRRAEREPIVEITQIKGDSETHPFLSPNDEFASFGDAGWELGNLPLTHPTTDAMRAGNYAREALKRGLAIEAKTGVNPYKFGVIGSTDSHTSLATADEDNFYGKHSAVEPSKDRASDPQNLGTRIGRFGWQYLAGGYAGVWARANTRSAIFDAMVRREVYATTGPRMTVRFFGGWDFTDKDLADQDSEGDWIARAYERGVPMGSDLKNASLGGDLDRGDKGSAPRFLVSALKDPMGANLDRVQIVKGWVDSSGALQEKVFDIAWSDSDASRKKDRNGKIPVVGNTVNTREASYENSIGAAELRTVWTDPEFDAKQRAFYYVRVLEIPTPRWVLFDALRYGAELRDDMELIAQERAYTSPIWYKLGAAGASQ